MDAYELHSRVGQFSIPSKEIQNNSDEIMLIMSKMIIVRCEHLYHSGWLEYIALSPLFEKIEDGQRPPYYSVFVLDGEVEAKRMTRFDL